MKTAQALFVSAASLMLIDAVAYSAGALRPLHRAFAVSDPYLNRRLLLNLMLANAGLYFTSIFTFVGASLASAAPPTASLLMTVSLAVCLYSTVTIPFLTPSDSKHAFLRGIAAILIILGLIYV